MTAKQMAQIAALLGVSVKELEQEMDLIVLQHIREWPAFNAMVAKYVDEILMEEASGPHTRCPDEALP